MKRLWNFGWLSTDDSFRLLLSLAVGVLVARHLGPQKFGALAYLFGVVGLLMPLTACGLDTIMMRRLVEQPDERERLLGTAFTIRAAGAMIATAAMIGFVAMAGGPEGVTLKLAILAALSLPFLSVETFNGYFKASERMAWIAAPRIAARLASAAVAVWLVATGAGLLGFTALRVAEVAMFAAAALVAYSRSTRAFSGLRFDTALLRALLSEGTPLFLSSLAVMIYMRIDQIMLGQLSSAATLGYYSVAVRLSESAFFVPMALHAAFYPGLVRSAAADPERWHRELRRYYDIVALVMLGLAIAVFVAASTVLIPVFGVAYAPAVPMVWVLAAGIPFVGLGVARSAFLTIRGWLWTSPLTTALGAATNIALNFLLIPSWGGVGAACATVVSYWLVTHGSCLLIPWLRPTGHEITIALNPIGATSRLYSRWRAQRSANATT